MITTAGPLDADLVVAADGLAPLRAPRCSPRIPGPRYAGFTTWRLLDPGVPWAGADVGDLGPRQRAFSVVLPLRRRPGVLLRRRAAPRGAHSPDDELAELVRHFGTWPKPIPALLASATPGVRAEARRRGTG